MPEFMLTPQQQKVVDHRNGTLLVSAAAGSGKTRVLVDRLMGFLCDENDPANIDSFLLITYTKAAAAEMRAKIAAELSSRLSFEPENRHLQRQLIRLHAAQISTVHAFCAQLLREHAHALGLTADFRVMEQVQANRLRQQVLEQVLEKAYAEMQLRPERAELFDTLGAGRDDRNLSAVLLTLYEQVRCHPEPEAWMQESIQMLQIDDAQDALDTPWGAYLFKQLHAAVNQACSELQLACDEMIGIPALEAAYLPTYLQNLTDFSALGKQSTWNEIAAMGLPEKGRVKAVRNFEDSELLERVKARRSAAFDRVEKALQPFGSDSQTVLADLNSSTASLRELFVLLREFMERYDAEKRRLHAMDFSDLEHNALKLLRRSDGNPTDAALQIAGRYREIMVDEYQDTNEVQDAIFRAVSRDGKNCFFVGDVKQSIYRFRLADPGIFLEKYRTFPMKDDAEHPDGTKVLLSQNFRSRPQILQAVNDVFCGVMSENVGELAYTEAEQLQPGRVVLPLQEPEVELHCIATARGGDENAPVKAEAEAAFAADRIARMLREGECVEDSGVLRPICPEDIVILMRSPRTTAPVYLSALWSAGIPAGFEQSGELLDTLEVQLFHCMLQVIDNPRQDIPLAAVLLSPLFCFSASELSLIRGRSRKGSLYDALREAADEPKCAQFLLRLNQLRVLRPALLLGEYVQRLLKELDLEVLLRSMPDGEQRLINLREFVQYLDSLQLSLSQALSQIEQLREQGSGILAPGTSSAGAVRIMSIHSSKGLEFPVVLLCDLSRRFNMEDLRAQVLTHPQWGVASVAVDAARRVRYPTIAKQALSKIKEAQTKSEELRVLYVAMTRARERLIMSYCSASLDRILKEMVIDAAYPVSPDRAMEATCPGDWVLQTAVTRTDAGALFVSGRPAQLRTPQSPWRIEYHTPRPAEGILPADEAVDSPFVWPPADALEKALCASYPHLSSLAVPMKLTATQLKGRVLDDELSDAPELLPERKAVKFPLPDFSRLGTLSAAERGTAMHLFMQFADYSRCTDLVSIEGECSRLLQQEFLTAQQINAVDREKILEFFLSELGKQVLASENLVREFKFSVLEPAEKYYPDAGDDEVLLQGVVDCCLNEPNGLTVLDFKTDRILPGEENRRGAYYSGQLRAYADALERIFEKPVLHRVVYFFATGKAVEV